MNLKFDFGLISFIWIATKLDPFPDSDESYALDDMFYTQIEPYIGRLAYIAFSDYTREYELVKNHFGKKRK